MDLRWRSQVCTHGALRLRQKPQVFMVFPEVKVHRGAERRGGWEGGDKQRPGGWSGLRTETRAAGAKAQSRLSWRGCREALPGQVGHSFNQSRDEWDGSLNRGP